MKTTSDHLFKLIKSLSGTEKGYFKKHSSFHVRNDQNNYSKLFDAIDAQKTYDEKALLEKFSNEQFINQFSVAKNYLYDTILESLNVYHTSSNSELRNLMNKTEILVDKGLYVQAKKILKKVKSLAILYEKFSFISEINLLEQTIYRFEYNVKDWKKNFENQNEEIEFTMIQISNLLGYERLKSRLYQQLIEDGGLRTTREIKNYDWLIEDPLLKDEKRALSVHAKLIYYDLYARYYDFKGDFSKSYNASLKLVKLIKENEIKIKDDINYLSRGFHFMSIQCYNLGKYTQSLEYLSMMEKLTPTSDSLKFKILFRAYNSKIHVYFQMGNFKKCLQLISEIEPLLGRTDIDKMLKQFMYRYIPHILMILGEYKQALKWLVKGNTSENYDTRKDVECISRIMEIVLHYELGKLDIMESRINSTYRFLDGNQKLYPLEKLVLGFMRKLINVNSKKVTIDLFKEFKDKLQPILNNPLDKRFLIDFDIMSWLDSKIENKTFEEIVRRKIKK